MEEMNDFETDYLISWDFSENDCPCVTVSELSKDEKSNKVIGTVLGISYRRSGVISFRQVLSEYDRRKIADLFKQKEGEWVTSDIPEEKYVCSVCGGACWYYDCQGDVAKSRYCPNCGAHMRKEDEGK